MLRKKHTITAIDIGTSKICVLIGESGADGRITVLGHSESASGESVRKGEILNMDEVSNKLYEAIERASSAANREIITEKIFFSVTGSHIHSVKGIGSVVIQSPDRKVTELEIAEARKNAHQVSLPMNCCAINYVESDFILNSERRLENPLGHVANRLEAVSYCVYGDSTAINNFRRPIEECGFIEGMPCPVFSGIASAEAVMSQDDLKNGSLVIDIGAGTSEYLLCHHHGYFNCGVIPVGCDHIANDIAIGLDIPIKTSRNIMLRHIVKENFPDSENITIEGSLEQRKIPSASVEKIVELRVNELFEIIQSKLNPKNVKMYLGRGVIICGGGAEFPMLIKSAEKIFDAPVRIGKPRDIEGSVASISSPRYTCAVGLLKHGAVVLSNQRGGQNIISAIDRKLWSLISNVFRKVSNAIRF